MQIRHITLEEYYALSRIQSIAFVAPFDPEATRKKMEETPETLSYPYGWGCFDENGVMTAGLEDTPFEMYYDGHVVKAGGIGGVASLPEARMKGGIRAIFERVFEENRARGVLFSVLYPFSNPYYRQFGYELCREGIHYRFPMEALKFYRNADVQARMHEAAEGSAPFEPIYRAYAQGYNYALAREENAWRNILGGDYTQTRCYRYILSRGGRDTAYCMFRPHQPGGMFTPRTLVLTDYAYVDATALRDLLGFLYKLAAQYSHVRIEVPSDIALPALLAEPNEVEVSSMPHSMARMLDVEQALRLMRHPAGGGSYSLRVRDDFLPVNSGIYRVAYGPQGVEVVHSADGEADLSLSVQTLAQMCLGYIDLHMACLKQDVCLVGNEGTLARVFVRKPMFLTDRF